MKITESIKIFLDENSREHASKTAQKYETALDLLMVDGEWSGVRGQMKRTHHSSLTTD